MSDSAPKNIICSRHRSLLKRLNICHPIQFNMLRFLLIMYNVCTQKNVLFVDNEKNERLEIGISAEDAERMPIDPRYINLSFWLCQLLSKIENLNQLNLAERHDSSKLDYLYRVFFHHYILNEWWITGLWLYNTLLIFTENAGSEVCLHEECSVSKPACLENHNLGDNLSKMKKNIQMSGQII